MQTIIIVLDSKKMSNPDLDIRYVLPDRIEEYSNGLIKDNGYDYLSNNELGLWLETDDAKNNVEKVIQLITTEIILENDLSKIADIFISEDESAELECCCKIYPIQVNFWSGFLSYVLMEGVNAPGELTEEVVQQALAYGNLQFLQKSYMT